MATLDEVRRIALALPGATEKVSWGSLHRRMRDRGLAWERPARQGDLAALGDLCQTGVNHACLLGERRVKWHPDLLPRTLKRI